MKLSYLFTLPFLMLVFSACEMLDFLDEKETSCPQEFDMSGHIAGWHFIDYEKNAIKSTSPFYVDYDSLGRVIGVIDQHLKYTEQWNYTNNNTVIRRLKLDDDAERYDSLLLNQEGWVVESYTGTYSNRNNKNTLVHRSFHYTNGYLTSVVNTENDWALIIQRSEYNRIEKIGIAKKGEELLKTFLPGDNILRYERNWYGFRSHTGDFDFDYFLFLDIIPLEHSFIANGISVLNSFRFGPIHMFGERNIGYGTIKISWPVSNWENPIGNTHWVDFSRKDYKGTKSGYFVYKYIYTNYAQEGFDYYVQIHP